MALPTASDNVWPKLILSEGAAPASPSAGQFKLYYDSGDHLLKWKDSSGTVTTIATGSSGLSDPMTTRGDIIVRNASNVTARLAKGSADTYLGSDGTDVSYSAVTDAKLSTSDITTNNASTTKHGFAPKYPNDATKYLDGTGAYSVPAGGGGSGALVFLEAHTASASATLNFSSTISATYDTYIFECVGIIPATNSVEFIMRMGTGGGPTYDSGNNYSWEEWRFVQGASSAGGTTATSGIRIVASPDNLSNSSTFGFIGTVKLYNVNPGTVYPQIDYQGHHVTGSSAREGRIGGGTYEVTTSITAVQFLMSSGNITSGVIRAYGMSKS